MQLQGAPAQSAVPSAQSAQSGHHLCHHVPPFTSDKSRTATKTRAEFT